MGGASIVQDDRSLSQVQVDAVEEQDSRTPCPRYCLSITAACRTELTNSSYFVTTNALAYGMSDAVSMLSFSRVGPFLFVCVVINSLLGRRMPSAGFLASGALVR